MSLSRILITAIAMAVVLSLGVRTVESAIPNPTNKKYYACFSKKTGDVRLINYPKVSGCRKGERLRTWNAKGPAGPQGVQGAQGAQGPQGPQGPAGPADWNAIPNIPAGFADGVDDGRGYYSDTVSCGRTLAVNEQAFISLNDAPRNLHYSFMVLPESVDAYGMRLVGVDYSGLDNGKLRIDVIVKNSGIYPGTCKVRYVAFDQGIAPAGRLNGISVSTSKKRR